MKIRVLLSILLVVILSGCSKPKQVPEAKEETVPLVKAVDNTQLAKVILRPKQKDLIITRDPFKPILSVNSSLAIGSVNNQVDQSTGKTIGEDVILIGVVKLGNDFRAFIKSSSKSGVYKTGDKVGLYTVSSIELDKVVLMTPDNQRIVKVRGKK